MGSTIWQIIFAVIAAGGISALVSWILGRHKPAIERAAAQQAEQRTISAIRTEDIDNLIKITTAQDQRIERLERRLQLAEERATSAEDRATHAEARAVTAEGRAHREAQYVEILLDHWPTPPPPPRPGKAA